MKKYLIVTASLIAGATLMLAAAPGIAASIDINVGVPGVYVQPQAVYVQPRPVYIQPQYENDWRERQVRAVEWRDNPRNHGQQVSAAVHARNDGRKNNRQKHHGNDKHGD
ncbi:MAG: hypothetical protein JWQ21_3778 [Herminiimonas sp.]|jgi:hypothetical protein|nr:hypothetical protein [Herminiimonas sp.]